MSEQEVVIKLSIMAVVVCFVCLILIIDKVEKKRELKESLEKKEKAEKREKMRLENSKTESIEWNEDIQADSKKSEILYKPNRQIKALVGNYSNSISVFTNEALKSMGIQTDFVPCAHNIIDKINNNETFDIIITNHIYNRGECGEQVLEELKAKKGIDIPIVVLTIDKNARDEYVKHLGFDEYIAKPITPEKAIPIFEKVISNLSFEKVKKQ